MKMLTTLLTLLALFVSTTPVFGQEYANLQKFLMGGHYASPAAANLYLVNAVTHVTADVHGDVVDSYEVSNDVQTIGMALGVTAAIAELNLGFEIYNPKNAQVHFSVRCRGRSGQELLYGHSVVRPYFSEKQGTWIVPDPELVLYAQQIRIPAPMPDVDYAYIQKPNGARYEVWVNNDGMIYLQPHEAGVGQIVMRNYNTTMVFDLATGEYIPNVAGDKNLNVNIYSVVHRLITASMVSDVGGSQPPVVTLDFESDGGKRYIDLRQGFAEVRVDGDVDSTNIFANMRDAGGRQPIAIGVRDIGTGAVVYRDLSLEDFAGAAVFLGLFESGHYQIWGVYPEQPASGGGEKG